MNNDLVKEKLRDLTVANTHEKITLLDYFIMLGTIFVTLFFGFASYALENMNEGLYAEIPREMMVTGNYTVPHLNFVPYLEKPPMLYWLITLSYHLFGVSTFGARLVPVVSGAIVCLSLFYFAKKIKLAREGWIAAIVLTTSAGFILISRVIIFDMTLTAFFTLSLLFFYLWYIKEIRWYLWLSFALLGCAYLTKGLLSVALVPFIAMLFMIVQRTPWKKFFRLFDIPGICIFLLTIVPWTIAASIRQPGFAWDFFINEQVYRFLNKRIPDDYHHGPIWYYIIPTIILLLPWSVFFPILVKRVQASVNTIDAKQMASLKKFLWIWFLAPFIFFSLSLAKAQYYIIIGIPALAFLLGIKFNEYFKAGNSKIFTWFFYTLVIGGCTILSLICISIHSQKFASHLPNNWILPHELGFPLLVVLFITIPYAILGSILIYYKRAPIIRFILIAGLILPWIYFLIADKQMLSPQRSEKLLGEYILNHDPNRPVYLYQDYENISSILYYVKKRVAIIDTQSMDLYYGATTPAAKGWFITSKQFTAQAQTQPVYVVMEASKLAMFNIVVAPLKFCVASRSGDTLVLSNKMQDCQSPPLTSTLESLVL